MLIKTLENLGEVEFKRIEEVCEILNSKRMPITKKYRIKGVYPYYGANGIQDYVKDYIFDGDFVLMGEDGSVMNKDGTPVVNWASGKIWVNNHAHVLQTKDGLLLRFFYYALQVVNVNKIVGGVPPKINQKYLRNIEIPIPPLSIQKQIVEILDKFMQLGFLLQEELNLREKQYTYYRDKLLDFGIAKSPKIGIDFKRLGDVAEFRRGKPITKKGSKVGNIPVISGGKEPSFYTDSANFTGECCAIASSGSAGFVSYWNEPIFLNDAFSILPDKSLLLTKYVYYFLKSKQKEIYHMQTGPAVSHVYPKDLKRLSIPIPQLSIQKQIVGILDKFIQLDSLLKKELNLREKQYTYYRDKLLDFKRKGGVM